jgi:Asp-tRNA(Asn)/Glu-tRNA(Gln) amidotransferase A subunit family amidase
VRECSRFRVSIRAPVKARHAHQRSATGGGGFDPTGLATLPGLPSTVVPLERSKLGLPIGIQIVGPYLEDTTTIKFAELMEQDFGAFVAPPAMG